MKSHNSSSVFPNSAKNTKERSKTVLISYIGVQLCQKLLFIKTVVNRRFRWTNLYIKMFHYSSNVEGCIGECREVSITIKEGGLI